MAFLIPGAIALFALIGTFAMTIALVKARNRIRLIEAAPMCNADELITGLAKMKGKIMAVDKDDLLVSPMTGTRCVFFKFVVEEQRTRTVVRTETVGGRSRQVRRTETYWHPIITDVQAVPTVVRDKTGDASLDLTSAELTLGNAMQAKSGTFNSVPQSLERTLQKRYGVSSKGLIFNKSMRYTEAVIEQGAKVFVVGDCKIKKSGKPGFYKGDNPLLVTDRSEDELVGHYKKRFYGFLVGVIVLPLILFSVAAFVGYEFSKHEKDLNPFKDKQAQQNTTNKQNSQNPGGNQQPQPMDEISQKIAEMKDPTDKWVRVRACDAFGSYVKLQPQRRDEVAQALNVALNDPDKDVRAAAIRGSKVWGTKRHNEATLRQLANSKDFFEKQDATLALNSLAP